MASATAQHSRVKSITSITEENARAPSVADRAGLTDEQAARRLDEYGPNMLPEKHASPVLKFLSYFWGPIPWMIEVAAVLSAVVRHWADLIIIGVLLVFNAVIGFWQEYKADNAIALLKRKLALTARVLRSGQWKSIPAAELVPGDVVRVRLGDIVPADLQLTAGDHLEVDQSALTGESLPVEKNRSDTLYSGSVVRRGEARAVVTATGTDTYFGQTARLVGQTTNVSHYQKAVLRIGHFLILITVALVLLIIVVALFRNTPLLETTQFCLILTVAAIPVALPAVLSVTMAVGAMKLAQRQAIVSRLVSIEEMAGMDVLCSDKTGTLTKNHLVLGEPQTFGQVSVDELLIDAALASRREDDDPIERAIFEKLDDRTNTLANYDIQSFEPFDPVSKRTEATVRRGDRRFKVSKGAPQVIEALCEERRGQRHELDAAVDELAGRGYRALGVARTNAADQWEFIGLLPLYDPPREDSAATIKAAKDVGVSVKMVTGDHLAIAKETARQMKLTGEILSAEELFEGDHPVDSDKVQSAAGFAQVFPEHKYNIVASLQKEGHFVGMTGDGVNDAPALKKADMGIAVSGATEAARSAADLVLTAPGLSVIIEAINESRKIFRRMNAYAIYRIAETIRVLLFMTLSILIFDFYPVTAVMIILLALLNDGAIMMIAYDKTDLPNRPVRWNMNKVLTISSALGVLGVIASFVLFWFAEQVLHLDRPTTQTLMFLKLTVAGHMTIYLARTGEQHFWCRPFPALKLLLVTEFTQLIATFVAAYGLFMAPIGWTMALMVWGYALLWFVLNDQIKVRLLRFLNHQSVWEHLHSNRLLEHLHPASSQLEGVTK